MRKISFLISNLFENSSLRLRRQNDMDLTVPDPQILNLKSNPFVPGLDGRVQEVVLHAPAGPAHNGNR